MDSLKHRYRTAIWILAIVAPIAVFFQYNVPPPADLGVLRDRVPQTFGDWIMTAEHEPGPLEIEILETKAILTRSYSCGGETDVDLSIVYAANNRRVAHPPEICYKGSGWSVEGKSVSEFAVGGHPFRANRLLLRKSGRRLLVLYWYKAGPAYHASYLKMQWGTIWYQLTFRSSSSALLRASAQSAGPDDDSRVFALLEGFTALALPSISAALP
ncbi:EpsI family protein [bacterium]|nr:EpsI family protein [bacterium]